MSIVSRPLVASVASKATLLTSIRGSQRASASRIACSMLPIVLASIESKTKSCTPQPNSGRIGRSPGAVPRMSWIACSMSCSSRASAIPPRRSTASGKASPEPMISDTGKTLSEVDQSAGDIDRGLALNVHGRALERQDSGRLDTDRGALDRDRRARLHVDRLGLRLGGAGDLVGVGALGRGLFVLFDLDDHVLIGLDLEVLLRVLV